MSPDLERLTVTCLNNRVLNDPLTRHRFALSYRQVHEQARTRIPAPTHRRIEKISVAESVTHWFLRYWVIQKTGCRNPRSARL